MVFVFSMNFSNNEKPIKYPSYGNEKYVTRFMSRTSREFRFHLWADIGRLRKIKVVPRSFLMAGISNELCD